MVFWSPNSKSHQELDSGVGLEERTGTTEPDAWTAASPQPARYGGKRRKGQLAAGSPQTQVRASVYQLKLGPTMSNFTSSLLWTINRTVSLTSIWFTGHTQLLPFQVSIIICKIRCSIGPRMPHREKRQKIKGLTDAHGDVYILNQHQPTLHLPPQKKAVKKCKGILY